VNPATGQRLVRFGKFAGFAGMIDMLRVLGERLLALGFSTPFLVCPSSTSLSYSSCGSLSLFLSSFCFPPTPHLFEFVLRSL
jgi:alpha-aminoadipic semialdehyde synthase